MITKKIGIIGLGNLGTRIIERLIKVSAVDPSNIIALARPGHADTIERLNIIAVTPQEMCEAEVVLLATKPGQFKDAWAQVYREKTSHNPLLISFMANISLAELQETSGLQNVVRVMTTTACSIGQGVGIWQPSQNIEEEKKLAANSLLEHLGKHQLAATEQDFVYATVLSSLNGLIFTLGYYFEQAMNEIGAPKRYRDSVWDVLASVALYHQQNNGVHPLVHADAVTSPSGTTSAMRLVVERAGLPAVFAEAFIAAAERAKAR